MNDVVTAGPEGFAGTAFFGRTYSDTLNLVHETRDYLAARGSAEADRLEPKSALAFAEESMRVTARLTQAMAWLLAQRAVHTGELEAEDLANPQWRLGAHAVCLAPPSLPTEALPLRLRDLMERSERLYRRVARLDEMVARGAA